MLLFQYPWGTLASRPRTCEEASLGFTDRFPGPRHDLTFHTRGSTGRRPRECYSQCERGRKGKQCRGCIDVPHLRLSSRKLYRLVDLTSKVVASPEGAQLRVRIEEGGDRFSLLQETGAPPVKERLVSTR